MAAAIPMMLMAASTVMTMAGQINEGRRAKQAGWARAEVLDKQGEQAFASKATEGLLAQREGEITASNALARAAASGGSGGNSYIEAVTDIFGNARYNQEVSLYEGEAERRAKGHEAELSRWSGSEAKRASQASAMVTAVKGAASMASIYGGGGGGGFSGSGINQNTGAMVQSGSRGASLYGGGTVGSGRLAGGV